MIENCCAFTGYRPKKFPWGYDETDLKKNFQSATKAPLRQGFTPGYERKIEKLDRKAKNRPPDSRFFREPSGFLSAREIKLSLSGNQKLS